MTGIPAGIAGIDTIIEQCTAQPTAEATNFHFHIEAGAALRKQVRHVLRVLIAAANVEGARLEVIESKGLLFSTFSVVGRGPALVIAETMRSLRPYAKAWS